MPEAEKIVATEITSRLDITKEDIINVKMVEIEEAINEKINETRDEISLKTTEKAKLTNKRNALLVEFIKKNQTVIQPETVEALRKVYPNLTINFTEESANHTIDGKEIVVVRINMQVSASGTFIEGDADILEARRKHRAERGDARNEDRSYTIFSASRFIKAPAEFEEIGAEIAKVEARVSELRSIELAQAKKLAQLALVERKARAAVTRQQLARSTAGQALLSEMADIREIKLLK